ncbi:reverse transcriptase domain-containing protein [Tanacetum coccineum]
MLRPSLGGAARNCFDDLDPKSVDSFKELSQKFLEEFSQPKRYAKDPTKIHDIKRRQNKGLQAFMDQFKSEILHIKGVPLVLRISAFMHGHVHPELAKKLNDKIPKTVDEMFERVRAFIRGEVAAGDMGHNTNDRYQLKKKIEEVVASGKLAHMVKDIRRTNQRNGSQRRNSTKVIKSEGSLSMVKVYQRSCMNIASETSKSTSGQNSKDAELRWTRMRSLRAVGSTIHSMIKFPTNQGIVTMVTSREALWECGELERVQGSRKVEYSQIKMTEDDGEKAGFHTEGYTVSPYAERIQKNSAATLQRMMEEVLANQRGRNVEIYLEKIVIKSKSELDLVQDVEETLRKLKRVSTKIDPVMSSFGVKEGRFLGFIVTKEGVRADPEKVKTIILNPIHKKPKSNMKFVLTTNSH